MYNVVIRGIIMEFIKIKVTWEDYPENLYRIILVKKNITLEELNDVLCLLLKTRFEHLSLFRAGKTTYINEEYVELPNQIPYENVKLVDVLDKEKQILFDYDLGAGYRFIVKRCSKYFYEYPFKTNAILVEARGDGIFEDNMSDLYSIMENEELDESEERTGSFGELLPKDYNFFQEFDYDYINSALIKGISYFLSWQDDGLNDDLIAEDYD